MGKPSLTGIEKAQSVGGKAYGKGGLKAFNAARHAFHKAPAKRKAPLGQGGRFAALKNQLAKKSGVTNPGALAAYIGRKKFGKAKFQKLAAKGK